MRRWAPWLYSSTGRSRSATPTQQTISSSANQPVKACSEIKITSSPLEDEIRRYFKYDPSTEIFKGELAERPCLTRDGTNRILLYVGAFNPPHVAHLRLLQYAYENCDAEFNLVAAFVVFHRDDYIAAKQHDLPTPFILSKKQRIQLWEEDARHLQKQCWFTNEEHHAITGDFAKFLRAQGFDVEFVALEGPDHVRLGVSIPSHCQHLITTDISRQVDFMDYSGGRMIPLRYYDSWKIVPVRKRVLKKLARDKAVWQAHCHYQRNDPTLLSSSEESKLVKSMANDIYQELLDSARNRKVWVCGRQHQKHRTVRFLAAASGLKMDAELSSTVLRRDLQETPAHMLQEKMSQRALSPVLLVSFCS